MDPIAQTFKHSSPTNYIVLSRPHSLRCFSLKILTKISRTGQGKKDKGKGVVKYENSGAELKVLVVDDDRFSRNFHLLLLQRVGVTDYFSVENGKEAVDLHCDGETFDLILMDYNMPIMNGTEATKQLRSMGICSNITGVSSPSRKETYVQKFVEAGLDDYYKKPFTEDMLSEILDKIKP